MTDPTWGSPRKRIDMHLAAVAPKYGWTDLAQVARPKRPLPAGSDRVARPRPRACRGPVRRAQAQPAAGALRLARPSRPGRSRSPCVPHRRARRIAANPLCARCAVAARLLHPRALSLLPDALPRPDRRGRGQLRSRSSARAASPTSCSRWRSTAGWRSALRSVVTRLPGQGVLRRLGHLVQNKAKEWADLCDRDRPRPCRGGRVQARVQPEPAPVPCASASRPASTGSSTTTRGRPGTPASPGRRIDVTVSLQTCRQNASRRVAAGPAGRALQRRDVSGISRRTGGSSSCPGRRRPRATPSRTRTRPRPTRWQNHEDAPCASRSPAGAGVATYDSERARGRHHDDRPDAADGAVAGATAGAPAERTALRRLPGRHTGARRSRRPQAGRRLGDLVFDLHGNAWRFPEGHRVRVEIAQDDDPYVPQVGHARDDRSSTVSSSPSRSGKSSRGTPATPGPT